VFIFFGGGTRSARRQLTPEQVLVLEWRYVQLFWVFQIGWGARYSLATLSPYGWAVRPLTESEMAHLDPTTLLDVHWWWRWGLVIGLAAVLVVLLLVNLY
jgi:hypothetical protein